MGVESELRKALVHDDSQADYDWFYLRATSVLELDGIPIEYIEENPRLPESGGDSYKIIKYGDRYFKKLGYTDSYGGQEWDGAPVEVERIPVNRVDYKEIKR